MEYDLTNGTFEITIWVEEVSPNSDAGGSIDLRVDDADTTVAAQSYLPTIKNDIITCGDRADMGLASSWTFTGTPDLDYNNFSNCSSGIPAQLNAVAVDRSFVAPLSDWHLQNGSPVLGSAVALAPLPGFTGIKLNNASKNKGGIPRPLP